MAAVSKPKPPESVTPARRLWRLVDADNGFRFHGADDAAAGFSMAVQSPLAPGEGKGLAAVAADFLARAAADTARAALDALPERTELRRLEELLAGLRNHLEALAGQEQALARRRTDPSLLAGPARDLGRTLLEIDAATAAVGRQRDESFAAIRELEGKAKQLRVILLEKARTVLLDALARQTAIARQRRLEGLVGLAAAAGPWLTRLLDGELLLLALADTDGLRAAAERALIDQGALPHAPAGHAEAGVTYVIPERVGV